MVNRLFGLLLLSLWPIAFAHADTGITVRDDRGLVHHFAKPPKRVITLLPSLTESVCALDACDRLVATDRYSDWPDAVRSLPKLGGIDDTPMETVVTLKPDVVLAARSSRAIKRLEELGIPVVTLEPQSLRDVYTALDTLATLLAAEPARDRVVAHLQQQLQEARARIPSARLHQSVYLEVAEHRYAASQSSYLGQVLAQLGLRSVVPGDWGAFPAISWEWVLTHPPDLIMVDETELTHLQHRPLSQTLRALNHGSVCAFTSADFGVMARPGPRLGLTALRISDCVARLPAPTP